MKENSLDKLRVDLCRFVVIFVGGIRELRKNGSSCLKPVGALERKRTSRMEEEVGVK